MIVADFKGGWPNGAKTHAVRSICIPACVALLWGAATAVVRTLLPIRRGTNPHMLPGLSSADFVAQCRGMFLVQDRLQDHGKHCPDKPQNCFRLQALREQNCRSPIGMGVPLSYSAPWP